MLKIILLDILTRMEKRKAGDKGGEGNEACVKSLGIVEPQSMRSARIDEGWEELENFSDAKKRY